MKQLETKKLSYNIAIVGLAMLSIMVSLSLLYILFIIILAFEIVKKRHIGLKTIIKATVLSIILPDNYNTLILFFVFGLLCLIRGSKARSRKNGITIPYIILVSEIVLSTLINQVPFINILISLIYFIPLIIAINHYELIKEKYIDTLRETIFIVVIIELFSIIPNYFLHHYTDWSTGTFGTEGGQQAQLFVFASLCLWVAISEVKTLHNQKDICKNNLFIIGLVLLLFSTNSWTLLAMLAISISSLYFFRLKAKTVIIIMIYILTIIGFRNVWIGFVPGNVLNPVKKAFSDVSYLNYRFYKFNVYKNTFVDIPKNNFKFLLIGNGLGYYNSRGALTCSGYYAPFYNKFFSPSTSLYTDKYILPRLMLAYHNSSTDYGSVVSRPYSSILALMGECGVIGIILVCICLWSFLRNRDFYFRGVVWILIVFCFIENYFEYPKIIITLVVALALIEKKVGFTKPEIIKINN